VNSATAESGHLVIEVKREGAFIDAVPVSLVACVEDALFRGVLAGRIQNDGSLPELEIRVHPDPSQPARADLTFLHKGVPVGCYDEATFEPQASAFIRSLVERACLRTEDRIAWRLVERAGAPPHARFSSHVSRVPYPLSGVHLASVPHGTFAVEFDAGVIEAIRERVATGGSVECAGLLRGALAADREREAVRVSVLEEHPLEPDVRGASHTHFAIGPASLRTARAAPSREGSFPLGWWHSHPPCAACIHHPSCDRETVFFSDDDWQVHQSMFPSPYMIALVVGKARSEPATQPALRLYGWERARIRERAFAVSRAGVGRA